MTVRGGLLTIRRSCRNELALLCCFLELSNLLGRGDTIHDGHLNVHLFSLSQKIQGEIKSSAYQNQMEAASLPLLDGLSTIRSHIVLYLLFLHERRQNCLVDRIIYKSDRWFETTRPKERRNRTFNDENLHRRYNIAIHALVALLGGRRCGCVRDISSDFAAN